MTKKYWIASKWVGFSHVNCSTAVTHTHTHTHVNILRYECASLAVKVNHRVTPKGITQQRLFGAAYRSSCSLRNRQQRRGCVWEEILYVWWYTAVIVATDCVSLQCQECSMSDRIFHRYGFLQVLNCDKCHDWHTVRKWYPRHIDQSRITDSSWSARDRQQTIASKAVCSISSSHWSSDTPSSSHKWTGSVFNSVLKAFSC